MSSGGDMTDGDAEPLALIGDVGGTNCRLAVAPATPSLRPDISRVRTYRCADYPTFEDAVAVYLAEEHVAVTRAVIAVAGPVANGEVAMTNHPWRISERGLAAKLGGAQSRLINDFEALAHALPALAPDDLASLGPARKAAQHSNMAVMGAGTGFGTAALARGAGGQTVLVGEGGHSAFAPSDALEAEVWKRLAARFAGYVQVEHLLSGPGLVNLHRALCEIEGKGQSFETPDAITDAADAGDSRALAVTDRFVSIFGAVAGDLAVIYGARSGVFIAGGVSQRILSQRNGAAFRARFEAKGEFSGYLVVIPTWLITHDQPGLLGAKCALADPAAG
jgi:glucokinase